MLLIEDDTLVHVDSASDILEHYGVKGMRWGVHRRQIKDIKRKHRSLYKKERDAYKNTRKESYRTFRESDKSLSKKANVGTPKVDDFLENNRARYDAAKNVYESYKQMKNSKVDYKKNLSDTKFINKYSTTDDLYGIKSERINRKIVKKNLGYTKAYIKNDIKAHKKAKKIFDQPFSSTAYSNGTQHLIVNRYNPLNDSNSRGIKNHIGKLKSDIRDINSMRKTGRRTSKKLNIER